VVVAACAERVRDVGTPEPDDHVVGRHLAGHRDLHEGVASGHLIGAPRQHGDLEPIVTPGR
jgi:hypothetical protein